MTKQELMETYTAEQLADMVIKLNSAMDSLKYSDSFLKSGLFDNPAVSACEARINILQNKINNLEEENGRLQSKLDTYNNYLIPRCTKEAKEMIDHNHFTRVRIVTWEQWNNRGEKSMNIPGIQKCQEEYEKLLKESPLEGVMNKITKDILEQKNSAMAMEFTRIICDLLKRYGVYVHYTETKFGEEITANSIEEQYGIVFDSMDFSQHDKEFTDKIKELEEELKKLIRERTEILWEFCDSVKKEDYDEEVNRLQSEVEKYRKAFEDAKKERDCQIVEYQKKIEELTNEKESLETRLKLLKSERDDLREEVEKLRNAQDFSNLEPIGVANIIINSEGTRENLFGRITGKGATETYRIFEASELRQIAEHLLVYCNHNEGG